MLQLARTLPMMAPRRVIVVAQAEKLMPIFRRATTRRRSRPRRRRQEGPEGRPQAAGEAELEALEAYLRARRRMRARVRRGRGAEPAR